ncbi:MAG: aminopeptidase N [Acidobacteria bacterium]|nr:aminopeptidase N [Acidobacteriota bacterium]
MKDTVNTFPAKFTTKYRKDYRPPTHLVDTFELDFDLSDEHTCVRSRMALHSNPKHENHTGELILDGVDLKLVRVVIDGRELRKDEYVVDEETLTLTGLPSTFVLETEVLVEPQANTCFEGLYRSGLMFLTQCEAEGFRRITYFLDRPDVMARYITTVRADRSRYPILLSNGNLIDSGDDGGGRHWAKWEDPFRKPSYLFALVAGDLHCFSDSFTTMSGRKIELRVYVEHHHADKCAHAMASLIRAMRWDEETFGLEYDLDLYMIVATDDFNMGAMENKGLNVFNSKFVLARPETATDSDYERIEGVIGHEYFHNWTGNRVTCRDWFQLTLKEGLTVFRDQLFTAAMTSAAVKRIDDVAELRTRQFPEDAGPMSHPIRPDAYQEMNNFYTATVYEKGAEVIRMYQTLFGIDGFRRGIDLYFEKYDGQAVTCDDFRLAMAEANGRDLTQFERWYLVPGTPVVQVSDEYDAESQRRTFKFTQMVPARLKSGEALPLHIPVAFGLIGPDGVDRPLRLVGEEQPGATTRVLELTEVSQDFVFEDVPPDSVPSYLRGFSAPVELHCKRSHAAHAFAMRHESDAFNRWEAGQQFAAELLENMIVAVTRSEKPVLEPMFVEAWGALLTEEGSDRSLMSLMLTLPSESYLAERCDVVDPGAIHKARLAAVCQLAEVHADGLSWLYQQNHTGACYAADRESIGRRRVANTCLRYLSAQGDIATCVDHLRQSDNMTDSIAALGCLCDHDGVEREAALAAFHERWCGEPLVIDKWFSLQAASDLPDTVERLMKLSKHEDFVLKNPNRARSLFGAFGSLNHAHFHRQDGAGYRFLTDHLLEIDLLNPQVASRLFDPMLKWRRLERDRGKRMRIELERMAATEGLSRGLREKVDKALSN